MVLAERKPEWLKIRPPGGANYLKVKGLIKGLKLHTVCEEAQCPNVAECWGGGTATVMLMGDVCTRGCKFCHVKSGRPMELDSEEPGRVAEAVSQLGLSYIVLTSVNRDDLPDGGADHFARTVEAIKRIKPSMMVEALIPDFMGDETALSRMLDSGVDVLAHNVETIERLTPTVRDGRASYRQSLKVLSFLKQGIVTTKSYLMVGLGETREEIVHAMDDLRAVGVEILTIGQYLRPSQWHLPVVEFVVPDRFREYERVGLEKGFSFVASGALVRSSHRAGERFLEMKRGLHASA